MLLASVICSVLDRTKSPKSFCGVQLASRAAEGISVLPWIAVCGYERVVLKEDARTSQGASFPHVAPATLCAATHLATACSPRPDLPYEGDAFTSVADTELPSSPTIIPAILSHRLSELYSRFRSLLTTSSRKLLVKSISSS